MPDWFIKLKNFFSERHRLFVFLIITLLIFGLYGPSLKNGFAYDDEAQIEQNPYIKSLIFLLRAFTSCLWENHLPQCRDYADYYRPLQTISYILTYFISGNPSFFHFINIVLYIIACYLIFLFLEKILDKKLAVFLALLIFLIHPIHSEAVIWIASVPELLFSIFSISLFLIYFSKNRHKNWLAPVFFFLALLSKETAAFLPLAIITYDYLFKQKKIDWSYLREYWRYLLFFVIYLLLRINAIGVFRQYSDTGEIYAIKFKDSVIRTILAFGEYLKKIFWPFPLNPFMPFELIRNLGEPIFIFNLFLIASFLALFVWGIFRKDKIVIFSLGLYFLFLFPAFAALNLTGTNIIAERYLFLPSLGFAILLGYWLEKLFSWSNKFFKLFLRAALLIIFAFSAYSAYAQNSVWQSSKILYDYIHKVNIARGYPADVTTLNLALIYEKEENAAEAEKLYREIIANTREVPTASHRAYNNLGVIYFKEGRVDEAIELFKKAIAVVPRHKSAYANLGIAYLEKGDFLSALENSIKALEIDPKYQTPQLALAKLYSSATIWAEDNSVSFKNFISQMLQSSVLNNWQYNELTPALTLLDIRKETNGDSRVIIAVNPSLKGIISYPMIFAVSRETLKLIPDDFKKFDFTPANPTISVRLKTETLSSPLYLYLVLRDFRYYKFEIPVD